MVNGFKGFLVATLAGDVAPVLLSRRPRPGGGNEIEFRWRRGLNSRTDLVKVAYNMSDADYEDCVRIFREAAQRQRFGVIST